MVVDETIEYLGNISIKTTLLLNTGILEKKPDLASSINFELNLINNGSFNYFQSEYMGATSSPIIKYAFYENDVIPSYTNSTASIYGNQISTLLSYSDDLLNTYESINIEVVYSFDFTSYKNNFETQIYNNIGSTPLSFTLQMKVL